MTSPPPVRLTASGFGPGCTLMAKLAQTDEEQRPVVIGEYKLTRSDLAAAVTLAREVAGVLSYPMDDVWWALCNVPADMAELLESPSGWRALTFYLADDLGMGTVDYLPSVH